MSRPEDPLEAERRRILAAYERRERRGRDALACCGHEDSAHVLRLQQRYRATLRLLRAAGLADRAGELSVLEIGCGDGVQLLELLQWGFAPRRLAGIDLRPAAVERARARLPEADLRIGCASALPWAGDSFDLVGLHTVMSSILDPAMRRAVAAEVDRVLAPGGNLLWYDSHRRNPRNPDTAPVTAAEIRALFPGYRGAIGAVTFLPHVARRLPERLLELGYPLLAAVPRWRSHHLALLVKPSP